MGNRESIGILVGARGRGTNLRAIVEASMRGEIPASIDVVIAPQDSIPATEFARNQGIPVEVIPPGDDYEAKLVERLKGCTIICLAGYMRLLPTGVLDAHPGRILNIHPALLPKFGGKGMYGIHVHRAVIGQGEQESGCTVHFVTPVYDEGEVLLQLKCPVYPGDSAETLAARVLDLETQAYPMAIRKVIHGESS